MSESNTIRVSLLRHGGFLGRSLTLELDSGSLSEEESRTLSKMINAANFFNLPAAIMPQGGADRFQYEVTVEEQAKRHTVNTADGAVPEQLQPLIDYLVEAARRSLTKPTETG